MKTRARDIDVSLDSSAHDPFAELAEMFESEVGLESIRRHAENSRRLAAQPGSNASAVESMDREFDSAFRDVLSDDPTRGQGRRAGPRIPAAGAGENAYRAWVTPRSVNPVSGSPLKSFVLDDALEDAIRNLSAPANPRGTIVVETQSFAPDRIVEERASGSVEPELDEFDELIASELAALNDHSGYRRRMQLAEVPSHEAFDEGFEDEDGVVSAGPAMPLRGERYGAAPSHRLDAELESQETADRHRRRPLSGAGFRILGGASLITLVVIGAAGYFALHGTSGLQLAGDAEPLLIKADAEPYKVPPKDPGGRSIPNQNKAVYERVANPGTRDPAPQQQALLADSEEPMELPVEQPYPDLPGVELGEVDGLDVKSEDRITTASAAAPAGAIVPPAPLAAETAVLQPRKVRTMVVLPDGTLVANPAESAQQIAGAPALIDAASRVSVPQAPVPATSMASAAPTPALADPIASTLAATSPVEPAAIGVPVMVAEPAEVASIEPAVTALPPVAPVAEPAVAAAPAITAPKTAVAPTARPAHTASIDAVPAIEKPQRAAAPAPVPEPETQVASLQPNGDPFAPPPAANSSGYFVQISSQPSQGLARQSMLNLGARFASVINGRGMSIKAADIPGKGTFYRVRVSAGSKDDALEICNRLRSAGGNCFVAR